MLPAASRVRHSADFAATLKRGRRARRGAVVVYVSRRVDNSTTGRCAGEPDSGRAAGARAGFIVSKAVGIAVVRNRVKRRLRHLIAQRIPQWSNDLDVVVRALPDAATASRQQLADDFDAALAAAHRKSR